MSDKYIDQTGLARILTNLKANFALFNHNHSASDVNSGTLDSARLPASGVTAGSYGPSANASPSHGGTFSVPYITFDSKGRATAASTKTITLPSASGSAGSVQATLIWTNARPNSNFNTQTITLSSIGSTYGGVIILYAPVVGEMSRVQSRIIPIGEGDSLSGNGVGVSGSGGRYCTVSSGGVFFMNGQKGSQATDNSMAVPLEIYGVPSSAIVKRIPSRSVTTWLIKPFDPDGGILTSWNTTAQQNGNATRYRGWLCSDVGTGQTIQTLGESNSYALRYSTSTFTISSGQKVYIRGYARCYNGNDYAGLIKSSTSMSVSTGSAMAGTFAYKGDLVSSSNVFTPFSLSFTAVTAGTYRLGLMCAGSSSPYDGSACIEEAYIL